MTMRSNNPQSYWRDEADTSDIDGRTGSAVEDDGSILCRIQHLQSSSERPPRKKNPERVVWPLRLFEGEMVSKQITYWCSDVRCVKRFCECAGKRIQAEMIILCGFELIVYSNFSFASDRKIMFVIPDRYLIILFSGRALPSFQGFSSPLRPSRNHQKNNKKQQRVQDQITATYINWYHPCVLRRPI